MGPLNKKVESVYGILGDGKTAVIEVAAACGLTLVPSEKRNPAVTTSFGAGELIMDAINRGCRHFMIGLGGSATNKKQIPVIALAGGVTDDFSALNDLGITSYFSILNEPMSLDQAMDPKTTFDNLRLLSNQLFRLIKMVKN